MPDTVPIAWFVTPHGYGHAARACAIMDKLSQRYPTVELHVFTKVPAAFFNGSVGARVHYHEELTDIGVAQDCPLREDLVRTAERLDTFLPLDPAQVERLAREVTALECRLVVCDIAPLGIAVAAEAGVPSVLVENFTWHWIYRGYEQAPPSIGVHADYLERLSESATYHIQTAPICDPGTPDLATAPVARAFRDPPDVVRRRLGLDTQGAVVLISMGGVRDRYPLKGGLQSHRDVTFVVPGAADRVEREGNLILLPQGPAFHHPDLVRASSVVVGKVGYSTVAEIYHAGVPFGYIRRPRFREAAVLARFVEEAIPSMSFEGEQFRSGAWLDGLPELLSLTAVDRQVPNGAAQAAEFIAGKMTK